MRLLGFYICAVQFPLRHIVLSCLLFVSAMAIGQVQTSTLGQLAVADSLTLSFHFDDAKAIADSVLANNPTEIEHAKALLIQARALERDNVLDEATQVALKALEWAEKLKLANEEVGARITLALIMEKIGELEKCVKHLNEAKRLISENGLDQQNGHYYVRLSSLIRVSTSDPDSIAIATNYANLALEFATKYDQPRHKADAHLLLASYSKKKDLNEYLHHRKLASHIFETHGDYVSAGYMYLGMSHMYRDMDSIKLAFAYHDTASTIHLLEKALPAGFYDAKAKLFHQVGEYDSVFANMLKWQSAHELYLKEQRRVEVTRLSAVNENERKQAALENQLKVNEKQQRLLIQSGVFIAIIMFVMALLFLAYRKLRTSNAQINLQSQQLETSLQRQKVLLAEVQHRVKNNLQVIIGLLDLQKEAPDSKSIEEITNESQKRIESMAFLHDKIYLSKDLDKVDLTAYLEEVAKLMQTSYSTNEMPVEVEVTSEISSMSMEKAIPLGLITVELLINSFKHAFEGEKNGKIKITTQKIDRDGYSSRFVYQDNGKGFDGQPKATGLGMEIITGLAGQLHGKVSMNGDDGFNATIHF